jgi:acyl carrier protein
MKNFTGASFKRDLKKIILTACNLDDDPECIDDDEPLFGPDSSLELDSIDALQISVAIKREYGITIPDSKELRRVFGSVNNLTDYLKSHPDQQSDSE